MNTGRQAHNPLIATIARITDEDFTECIEIVKRIQELITIGLIAEDDEQFLRLAGILDRDIETWRQRCQPKPLLPCGHAESGAHAAGVSRQVFSEYIVCLTATEFDKAPALISQCVALLDARSRNLCLTVVSWPHTPH